MSRTLLTMAVLSAVAFGLAGRAGAYIIAQYDFSSSNLTSSDSDGGTTASDLTFGTGITGYSFESGSQNGTNFGNPVPGLYIQSDDTASTTQSAEAALDNNQYIAFTITPTASMTLTGLSLDYAVFAGTGGSGQSLDILGFVRSSITGTTDLLAWNPGNVTGQTSKDWETLSVDLTGGGSDDTFANLGSPVTFYIYLADNKNQGNRGTAFDNIKIEGIPEPATLGLMALGGAGLVLLRRKRR